MRRIQSSKLLFSCSILFQSKAYQIRLYCIIFLIFEYIPLWDESPWLQFLLNAAPCLQFSRIYWLHDYYSIENPAEWRSGLKNLETGVEWVGTINDTKLSKNPANICLMILFTYTSVGESEVVAKHFSLNKHFLIIVHERFFLKDVSEAGYIAGGLCIHSCPWAIVFFILWPRVFEWIQYDDRPRI